jgi:putative ABC transport system substrate-binding protein
MTDVGGQNSEVSKSIVAAAMLFALGFLAALLFALCASVAAQQRERFFRIGYLGPGPVHEAFRERMRELGYVEGKNIIIEHRQGPQRYSELAAEFIALKVDCIVAVGIGAIRAARQATDTIPIVMGNSSADPVRHGLVASLSRPGEILPV